MPSYLAFFRFNWFALTRPQYSSFSQSASQSVGQSPPFAPSTLAGALQNSYKTSLSAVTWTILQLELPHHHSAFISQNKKKETKKKRLFPPHTTYPARAASLRWGSFPSDFRPCGACLVSPSLVPDSPLIRPGGGAVPEPFHLSLFQTPPLPQLRLGQALGTSKAAPWALYLIVLINPRASSSISISTQALSHLAALEVRIKAFQLPPYILRPVSLLSRHRNSNPPSDTCPHSPLH